MFVAGMFHASEMELIDAQVLEDIGETPHRNRLIVDRVGEITVIGVEPGIQVFVGGRGIFGLIAAGLTDIRFGEFPVGVWGCIIEQVLVGPLGQWVDADEVVRLSLSQTLHRCRGLAQHGFHAVI